MKREELRDMIRNVKYKGYSDWVEFGDNQAYTEVVKTIENFLDTYHEELEAKVYVYEKIIANSNFAPMLQMKPVESKPTAEDVLNMLRGMIEGKTSNDFVQVHVIENLIERIEEEQRPF